MLLNLIEFLVYLLFDILNQLHSKMIKDIVSLIDDCSQHYYKTIVLIELTKILFINVKLMN